MVHRHTSVAEAYAVLGLSQGASLDAVKTAYKQLALRTHPDKNPNDPGATLQFQQVGEAYHLLLKHLDDSSPPPHPFHPFYAHAHHHSHSHSHYQFDEEDYDEDEEDYEDLYGSDGEYYEEEEDLDFFMFLFEEMLNGRANRHAGARFQARGRDRDTETEEQYTARVERQREEQAAAAQRRKEQEEAWKARRQMEREDEARAGAERRKQKAETKKAEADAARKEAAKKVRDQQQKTQNLRSGVFAAARRGEADKVRKGIWEDGVDGAGGEVAPGMEEFVKHKPKDPHQTLLHIATVHGDAELVEWLDRHNAEAEERDRHGRTAFHLALQHGHITIVRYFLGAYPPSDEDSAAVLHADTPLLQLALASGEPEVVWLVLDAGLANGAAVHDAWTWVCLHEKQARAAFGAVGKRGAPCDTEKYEETKDLLMSWGGFTPPSTPKDSAPAPAPAPKNAKNKKSKKTPQKQQMPTPPESPPTPDPTPPSSQDSPPASPSTPNPQQQRPFPPSGRGRGRGRGRSRGRGRGRGAPPAHVSA